MHPLVSYSRVVCVLIIIILFIGVSGPVIISDHSVYFDKLGQDAKKTTIPPLEQWNRTFGGSPPDGFVSLEQTNDQGYIFAGYTYSFSNGKEDIWLVKTDDDGIEEWNTSFGGMSHDKGAAVIQLADGGFIVVGELFSSKTSSLDACVIKTDQNGAIVWNRTYDSGGSDSGSDIIALNDGGYVLTGSTDRSEGTDCFLLNFDNMGNMVWNYSFGCQVDCSFLSGLSLVQSEDGGFLITGQVISDTFDMDGFLLKTDPRGHLEWMKTYGGSKTDFFRSIYSVQDSIMLTGVTNSFGSGNYDVWIMKVDQDGNEEWNTSFGGSSFDEGYQLFPTSDQGFIITGYTFSFGSEESDAWMIKTDENGVEKWNQTYGGASAEKGFAITESNDNMYVMAGEAEGDGWLMKVSSSVETVLTPVLLMGRTNQIKRVNDQLSMITSETMIGLYLNPFQLKRYPMEKTMIISQDYHGILNDDFIIGFFELAIV